MKKTKKKNTATMMFDNSIIDKKHKTSDLVCFTDGSGDNMDLSLPIQFSFVVYEKKNLIHQSKAVCKDPINTTIKAEIMGINLCLCFLIEENLINERITLFSDSKWVVDWVCNKPSWNSKNTDSPYYDAFIEFRMLVAEFKDIEFIWIPRQYNTVADGLLR